MPHSWNIAIVWVLRWAFGFTLLSNNKDDVYPPLNRVEESTGSVDDAVFSVYAFLFLLCAFNRFLSPASQIKADCAQKLFSFYNHPALEKLNMTFHSGSLGPQVTAFQHLLELRRLPRLHTLILDFSGVKVS